MTNGITKLSDRQLKALPYLAGSRTLSEGARLADISRTTFYRWMEDIEFRRELEHIRDEASELAHVELKGLMLKSVIVLSEALEDSNAFVRLRAAQIALTTHLKASEIKDIEKRLDLLSDALPLWTRKQRR